MNFTEIESLVPALPVYHGLLGMPGILKVTFSAVQLGARLLSMAWNQT